MLVFKKADSLSRYLSQQKKQGVSIGFVPTMGALHQGHLSLIKTALTENALTVCSIFVNPTQFNNASDFQHYPVTTEQDIEKLLSVNCNVLFLPDKSEIYPADYAAKHYDLGNLETMLEGLHRPGHFQGVCQVVDRLLQLVQPHRLYLGAKDYQQCMVIGKLVELMGKGDEITLRIMPTLREEDGLAMSSRNLRLTAEQRQSAAGIYVVLNGVRQLFEANHNNLQGVESMARQQLEEKGFKVDYLTIADAQTLQPPTARTHKRVVLTAASLGEIRLIDNLLLN